MNPPSNIGPEPEPTNGHRPKSVYTEVLQNIPRTEDGSEDLSRHGREYANYFLPLIERELREERQKYVGTFTQRTTEGLIASGMVLIGRQGHRAERYFGYIRFVFSLGEGINPHYCNFGRGDMVCLSRQRPLPLGGEKYEMTVLRKMLRTITFISKREDIPGLHEGHWYIYRSFSAVTHNRMEDAIHALTGTDSADEVLQGNLSDAISSRNSVFFGPPLADVILSASPSDKAARPSDVIREKCPDLYDWAIDNANEFYAPIHSLQHLDHNGASESNLSIDTYRHEPTLNPAQLRAVKSAIKYRFSLIHGPPGTGKTTTIAILVQILLCSSKDLKILLCAKNHVAVDNMLESLRKYHIDALRLGMIARVRESLVEYALDYRVASRLRELGLDELSEQTESEDDEDLELDERRALAREKVVNELINKARVICATCAGAGMDILKNIRFDIVIIDEGSQCTEPESIIPIVRGVMHAVIVGDHQQLQPFTTSLYARDKGLSTSMFERMMDLGVPRKALDTQYRMNPRIGGIFSRMFYGGSVRHGVSPNDRIPPLLSRLNEDFQARQIESSPCVIINLRRSREVQTNDHSIMNRREARVVLDVLDDLLRSNAARPPHLRVRPGHIGIITPYARQKRLIHDLISRDQRFAGIGLPGVTSEGDIQASGNDNLLEIHTIDGFQGREKDIIIISTVRTGSGRNIGFLDDHRRLNVALTRARKQLILVCSVRTLSRNQNWRQFIDQARTFPDIVFASASRYPSGQY